ncbi:hypothetical protein GCM10010508_58810 [Streptomyces naganishii JCM 4654]|uniref:Uncharacterized protein n=1 Tax=Streptomyces naganishii JCM 4654 TaxID=1306179 RepID=A0A919CY06_9ACTN|nr:hypothetical protein GCM10010508_58810 [Streptomyces naganishii JCM 4654]
MLAETPACWATSARVTIGLSRFAKRFDSARQRWDAGREGRSTVASGEARVHRRRPDGPGGLAASKRFDSLARARIGPRLPTAGGTPTPQVSAGRAVTRSVLRPTAFPTLTRCW